jgi:hypothetical protein
MFNGKRHSTGSPTIGTRPSTSTSSERWQSCEEWAKRADFDQRARECARNNQPAADDLQFPEILEELHTHAQRGAQSLIELAYQARDEALIVARESEITEISTEKAQAAIVNQTQKIQEKYSDKLDEVIAAASSSAREEESFKSERQIGRPAEPVRDLPAFYVQLASIIALEALANTWFFKDFAENGVIGAVLMTTGISVLNVYFLGYWLSGFLGWRLSTSHPKMARRIIGAAFLLVGVCGAVALNVVIAGFRDVIVLEGEAPLFRTVVDVLMAPQRWLDLHDPMSFVLMLVGIGCFVAGAWKGRRVSDPIWGYREVAEANELAQARKSEVVESFKAEIHTSIDDTRLALHVRYNEDENQLKILGKTVRDTERRFKDLEHALDIIANDAKRQHRRFFDINRTIRGRTAVLPPYHDSPHDVAIMREQFPTLEPLYAAETEAKAQLARNTAELTRFDRSLPAFREVAIRDYVERIRDAENRAARHRGLSPVRIPPVPTIQPAE